MRIRILAFSVTGVFRAGVRCSWRLPFLALLALLAFHLSGPASDSIATLW